MWEAVELRELRVFLALAEELHFTRTAERLQLTPSGVSQAVRKLERKLGGQLLHRTSRRVVLTPLGERLLADTAPAIDQLTAVLRDTYTTNHKVDGTLQLGLLFPTSGGPHLTAIVAAFESRHPGCEVQVSEVLFDDTLGPLQRGELDVMAMRLPIKRPGLVIGPILSREPRVLAVARDHPLAGRAQVSIENVADYQVAPLDELFPEEILKEFIPHTTPGGRRIRRRRLRRNPRTPYELAALIARGVIVHPTVPSFGEYVGHPDIACIPINDLPPSETGLVWRRRAFDPRLRAFIQVTQEVLRAVK